MHASSTSRRIPASTRAGTCTRLYTYTCRYLYAPIYVYVPVPVRAYIRNGRLYACQRLQAKTRCAARHVGLPGCRPPRACALSWPAHPGGPSMHPVSHGPMHPVYTWPGVARASSLRRAATLDAQRHSRGQGSDTRVDTRLGSRRLPASPSPTRPAVAGPLQPRPSQSTRLPYTSATLQGRPPNTECLPRAASQTVVGRRRTRERGGASRAALACRPAAACCALYRPWSGSKHPAEALRGRGSQPRTAHGAAGGPPPRCKAAQSVERTPAAPLVFLKCAASPVTRGRAGSVLTRMASARLLVGRQGEEGSL
jgi:hypothetical protein